MGLTQPFAHAGMAQGFFDPARAIASCAKIAGAAAGIGIVIDIAQFHQPGDERGNIDLDGAAIRILKWTDSPITVRSLTMIGTPNHGGVPTSYSNGEFTLDDCMGNAFCESFNEAWVSYAGDFDKGLNAEDTFKFLDGDNGWNAAQAATARSCWCRPMPARPCTVCSTAGCTPWNRCPAAAQCAGPWT